MLKIDSLFLELILNKGLYYYYCSLLATNRESIISKVIVPIYQGIIEQNFSYTYSRFLRRHIRGLLPQSKYVPGDVYDPFSSEYEIMYKKLGIGSIKDWDFIVDTDSFLNRFLLTVIKHKSGERSEDFDSLLSLADQKGVVFSTDSIKSFSTIHKARTLGLHRLQEILSKDDIGKLAMEIYGYFIYYDEFKEAQKEQSEKLHGKRFKKIPYGYENYTDENGEPYKDELGKPIEWRKERRSRPCGDCFVKYGQMHVDGCDIEQCARCHGQRLGCGCKLDKDF